MPRIPTVDISDRKLREVNATIVGRALEEIGFVFLLRSPDNKDLPSKTYIQSKKVFDLSITTKEKYAHPEIFYQRGWTPNFKETGLACRRLGPSREDRPDAKECWGMGAELESQEMEKFSDFYPPNIWPDEVPDFQPAMKELYNYLYFFGLDALDLVELYLDKDRPSGYISRFTEFGPHFMRALHYPPITAEESSVVQWGCKHTDINFLTVLPASTRSGLWVRCHNGEWIPGRPEGNAVIVQVGDMLQHHTGGRFRSAVHEVRAPKEGTTEGRLSSALFIHARPDTLLNPQPKDNRFLPITAGNYLRKRLQAIGLASTRY